MWSCHQPCFGMIASSLLQESTVWIFRLFMDNEEVRIHLRFYLVSIYSNIIGLNLINQFEEKSWLSHRKGPSSKIYLSKWVTQLQQKKITVQYQFLLVQRISFYLYNASVFTCTTYHFFFVQHICFYLYNASVFTCTTYHFLLVQRIMFLLVRRIILLLVKCIIFI